MATDLEGRGAGADVSAGRTGPAPVSPLATTPRIADAVYERLRDAVVSGRLAAGDRLSVPALARQLGVSRSPVREAVARLITERLAVDSPRRGAVVASVDIDELVGLYEVREALEGVVARLAAQRVDAALVAALQWNLARHRLAVESSDNEAHVTVDGEFHALLRTAAGNRLALDWLDQLQSLVRVAMRTTAVTGGPAAALADHERITAAVSAGDGPRAEQAARRHIARLTRRLRASG